MTKEKISASARGSRSQARRRARTPLCVLNDELAGDRDRQHAEREQERMDDAHRRGVGFAGRFVAMPVVGLDDAG